jgi:hypothetical protein
MTPPEESRKMAEKIVDGYKGMTFSSANDSYSYLYEHIAAALEAERLDESRKMQEILELRVNQADAEGYRRGLEEAAQECDNCECGDPSCNCIILAEAIRAKIGEVK